MSTFLQKKENVDRKWYVIDEPWVLSTSPVESER